MIDLDNYFSNYDDNDDNNHQKYDDEIYDDDFEKI
jgi:hypothetical protein